VHAQETANSISQEPTRLRKKECPANADITHLVSFQTLVDRFQVSFNTCRLGFGLAILLRPARRVNITLEFEEIKLCQEVFAVHITPEQIVISKEAQKQFDNLGQVYRERMARKLFSGHLPTKSIQFPTSLKVVEVREGDYRLLFGKRESDVILITISRRDQLRCDIDRYSKKEIFRTTPLLDSSIATVYAQTSEPQVVAMSQVAATPESVTKLKEPVESIAITAGLSAAAVDEREVISGSQDLRFHLSKSFDLLLDQIQQFESSRKDSHSWSTMLVEGHDEFGQQLAALNDEADALRQQFHADARQASNLRQVAGEQLDKLERELQLGRNRLDKINQNLLESEDRTMASQSELAEKLTEQIQKTEKRLQREGASHREEINGVQESARDLHSQLSQEREEITRIAYRLQRFEEHLANSTAKTITIQSTVQRLRESAEETLERERRRTESLLHRLGKAFDERHRTLQQHVAQLEMQLESSAMTTQERLRVLEVQLADQQEETRRLRQKSEASWFNWIRKFCSRIVGSATS
jgi:hypothetical protein